MLMSDVMIWVAIAAGFVVALPALWMLTRGMWPNGFAQRMDISSRGVFKALFVGLIPAAILVLLIAASAKRLGPIPSLIVSATAIAYGLSGMVGHATLIGQRLWATADSWRQTRNGGLVLVCAALLPLVGWFLILPAYMVIGMGVNVLCLFSRSNSMPAAPAALAS